jgi:hypothetical protein
MGHQLVKWFVVVVVRTILNSCDVKSVASLTGLMKKATHPFSDF